MEEYHECLFKIQHKSVTFPIIYHRSQLSFTAMQFPMIKLRYAQVHVTRKFLGLECLWMFMEGGYPVT